MNPSKSIDWQLVPDYVRFMVWKQTPKYGVKGAIVITGLKIAFTFVALGMVGFSFGPLFAPASEVEKPLNAPSYDSAPHRQAASQVCEVETGKPGLVKASGKVVASHVMVVRQDGVMERMDTTEAWDRTESKKESDNIWVVGVCRADVQNRAVKA